MTGLGAGDVETDHAAIAPAHRQLGDLQAASCCAHRRADGVDGEVGAVRTAGESVHDGLHHLVEGEALLGAQFGSHAHLGVHHAVGGQVASTFVRHALDGVLVLHDSHGVGEGFQVQNEVVALGATVEPLGEIGHVGGGEAAIAVLGRQFDHGLGSESAVEVIVQQDLGCALQDLAHLAPAMSLNRRKGSSDERCNQFHDGYSAVAEMQCTEYAWRLLLLRFTSLQWGNNP